MTMKMLGPVKESLLSKASGGICTVDVETSTYYEACTTFTRSILVECNMNGCATSRVEIVRVKIAESNRHGSRPDRKHGTGVVDDRDSIGVGLIWKGPGIIVRHRNGSDLDQRFKSKGSEECRSH